MGYGSLDAVLECVGLCEDVLVMEIGRWLRHFVGVPVYR
jgi:hypothetical protein